MRRKDTSAFFALQLLGDAVLSVLSIVIAFHIRYQTIAERNLAPFQQIAWVLFLMALVLFYFFRSYQCGERSRLDCIYESFVALVILAVFTMALTYLTRGFAYPRSIIAISFFVQVVVITCWKQLMFFLYYRFFTGNEMVVFGPRPENERLLLKAAQDHKLLGKRTFVHEVNEETLGLIDENVEVMIMDFDKKAEVMAYCMRHGVLVSVMPTLQEVNLLSTELKQMGDIPVLAAKPFGLDHMQRIQKGLFDFLFSAVLLILVSPLLLGVAFAIALEDGFPMIYRQKRLTRGDREFTLYKFRTMVKNAEEESGPILATEEDPRITKVGRLLRKTRLDELPQLFNVLRGQMSLVGPRPERPFFVEAYVKEMPEFQFRTRVKAGITGLGQVMGRYTTTPREKLIFDMIYIKNYSPLMDLRICVRTVRILLSKTAAKGFEDQQTLESLQDTYKFHEGNGYFTVN